MPEDSTTPHAATDVIASYDRAHDWHSLNAMLNLYDKQGRIQFDKDIQAVREYVEKHVLPNTVRFNSTQDRLSRLIADGYYDESVLPNMMPNSLTGSTATWMTADSNSIHSSELSSSTAHTH